MEGLILLVAEALAALLVPLLVAAGALGAWLVGALAALVGAFARAAKEAVPSPKRRQLLRVSLGACVLLTAGWALLEFALFQPLVRAAAARITRKSGIELSFESARGWFSTGRLVLKGVHVRQVGAGKDVYDLRMETLDLDARVLSLLRGEISMESIHVQGIRGRYEHPSGLEHPPRKPFTSDVLEIADAQVDWVLRREGRPDLTLPLTVDRLRLQPFESVNAAFSVLFRGDGTGTLSDAPWAIDGEGQGEGRRTVWTARRLPVGLFSSFLGEPFDWLESGTVDVHVIDAWRRGEKTEVDLRWSLLFHDLRVAVPPRIDGLKRRLGDAVAGLANRHPKELPLEFTMTLDEKGFKGRMSLETLELWDALAAGLIDELASRSGLAAETIRELGRAGWGKLKGWLENRAKVKK